MHVPYKLRESNGLIIPKGPRFSSARTISCTIDGTVISFKAPKHRPQHSNDEQLLPNYSYSSENMIYRSYYNESIDESDNWNYFEFFYNAWAFYGPWFTGTLAELEMHVSLVKPVNDKNQGFSLFHPRAFEKIIGDYLTNNFSKYISESSGGKHHYIAPLNWQPLSHFPAVAVRLQVVPDQTVTIGSTYHFVFFPISDTVMASIQFIPSQLRAATQEELDKRVSRSTMHELMDNIIDSIQLTLSPAALAQQKTALEDLDDTSLVKEHLPLKWTATEQDNQLKKLEEQD